MAYTDEDIKRAVRAGAISRNQADRLIGFLAAPQLQAGRPAGDNSEEQFRLLTGFNNIFISIALVWLRISPIQICIRIDNVSSWAVTPSRFPHPQGDTPSSPQPRP